MNYLKIFILTLFFFSFGQDTNAQEISKKPWYTGVDKVEEIEIFINFPKKSFIIDPVYNFHLRSLVIFLLKDSSLHINIYEKDNVNSQNRAQVLEKFLKDTLKAPGDRVNVLPEKYIDVQIEPIEESGAENIRVLLTKSEELESGESLFRDTVVLEETPQKKIIKNNDKVFEIGLSSRVSKFLNDYSHYSMGVLAKLSLKVNKNLQASIGGDSYYYFEDSSPLEYSFFSGLDYIYNTIESSTQVYYYRNIIQSNLDNSFQSYDDIGLGQDFNLNILRIRNYKYQIGGFANFSFSNNSRSLRNSNVLLYGLKSAIYTPSGFIFRLQYTRRKLREIQNFTDSNEHLTFSVSFKY